MSAETRALRDDWHKKLIPWKVACDPVCDPVCVLRKMPPGWLYAEAQGLNSLKIRTVGV